MSQSNQLFGKKTVEKFCSGIKINSKQKKAAKEWLDLLKERTKPLIVNAADLNHKYSFHHLNIFSEFNLNSVKKLHPFIGLGYTALSYNYEYIFGVNEFAKIKNKKENHNGINLNSGFIYNITSDFYFQTHFHYIRIPQKDPISNKSTGAKYNQLKLGLGFRF